MNRIVVTGTSNLYFIFNVYLSFATASSIHFAWKFNWSLVNNVRSVSVCGFSIFFSLSFSLFCHSCWFHNTIFTRIIPSTPKWRVFTRHGGCYTVFSLHILMLHHTRSLCACTSLLFILLVKVHWSYKTFISNRCYLHVQQHIRKKPALHTHIHTLKWIVGYNNYLHSILVLMLNPQVFVLLWKSFSNRNLIVDCVRNDKNIDIFKNTIIPNYWTSTIVPQLKLLNWKNVYHLS